MSGTAMHHAASLAEETPVPPADERDRCSTTRYEIHAGSSDTTAATTSGQRPEVGQKAPANTMSGQCHRYQL